MTKVDSVRRRPFLSPFVLVAAVGTGFGALAVSLMFIYLRSPGHNNALPDGPAHGQHGQVLGEALPRSVHETSSDDDIDYQPSTTSSLEEKFSGLKAFLEGDAFFDEPINGLDDEDETGDKEVS
jgi:hypothetical protein